MTQSELAAFEDPTFDPFAVYEKTSNLGTLDPYPTYAKLREEGSVVTLERAQELVGDEAANQLLAAMEPNEYRKYFVVTFNAIHELDHDKLSSSLTPGLKKVVGRMVGNMNPPEHRVYRALLQHAFTRKALEHWSTELVDPVIERQIDAFIDQGHANLVQVLTLPFPVRVIGALCGLPEEDIPLFHKWAIALMCVGAAPKEAMEASEKLARYLDPIIEERRMNPTEDMIGLLVRADVEGEKLSNEDIISFCRLILFAGAETTYRSSGLLLKTLLDHPEQLDAIRNDRSLVPQAVEELLRYETILQRINRYVTADIEIDGQTIPAGSALFAMLGSANRDEARWPDADKFDISRKQLPHATFGTGPHMCLGMHLSRLENREFLNVVLDRMPSVRFDDDFPRPNVQGGLLRSVDSLYVRWD